MKKEPELIAALELLRRRFGEAMVVIDHWEADLRAVGIARQGAVGRLAYISVKPAPAGPRFYVALEDSSTPGSDLPYTNAGEYDELALSDAADIVGRHLALP